MYMYVNICAQTHSQLRIHKQKYTDSISVVEKQRTLPAACLCSGSSCSMAAPAACSPALPQPRSPLSVPTKGLPRCCPSH